MISFENFVQTDGVPIYSAIIRHIERGAASGMIADGDELPSRRVLSAMLGVNPNTIQKAYKILEERELITSHGGAKSVMTLDEDKITKIRRDLIAEEAGNFIRAMDAIGLNKNEALTLLDRLWEV